MRSSESFESKRSAAIIFHALPTASTGRFDTEKRHRDLGPLVFKYPARVLAAYSALRGALAENILRPRCGENVAYAPQNCRIKWLMENKKVPLFQLVEVKTMENA